MMAQIDVLCVGHAAYDLTMLVDHHPGPDEKCFASGLVECGGGPAANAAVTVARLGGHAAFAGYLGNDIYGQKHFQELMDEGVGTNYIVRGSHPTPLSVILVKPNGERTVVNYKRDTPVLHEDAVDFSGCNPGVILFDGHEPELSLRLAAQARERGIPTVLDAGSVSAGTSSLAPLVDYLVASKKFALGFTSESSAELALSRLASVCTRVVVTLGEQGLIWRNGDDGGALDALEVNAVDTTGAGDVFHGAFSFAIASGSAFCDALKQASAAAALSCTRVGARGSIPRGGEVRDFLKAQD